MPSVNNAGRFIWGSASGSSPEGLALPPRRALHHGRGSDVSRASACRASITYG